MSGDRYKRNRMRAKNFFEVREICPMDVCIALHPWDDVTVVFEEREDDMILLRNSMGDKIDCFGAAFCEDDFFGIFRVQEFLDSRSRLFILLCRFFRKRMHAAMCIGIGCSIHIHHGFQYGVGFL